MFFEKLIDLHTKAASFNQIFKIYKKPCFLKFPQ